MNNIRYVTILIFVCLLGINTLFCQTVWEKYRSSVKLGIGYIPIFELGDSYDYNSYPEFNSIYEDKTCHYPAINFSYSYSLSKKFDVEMALGYTSKVTIFRNTFSDNKEGKIYKDIFFASPRASFYWIRRNSFSLYSSLGFSFVNVNERNKGNTYCTNNNSQLLLNATFLGMTFGRKIYGLLEFGASVSGCIQSGIGYRF